MTPRGRMVYSLSVKPTSRAWVRMFLLKMSLPVKYRTPQKYWSLGISLARRQKGGAVSHLRHASHFPTAGTSRAPHQNWPFQQPLQAAKERGSRQNRMLHRPQLEGDASP